VADDPGPPLKDWTAEEWDILARLRRQRNLALADAQVGPERATADQVRAAGGLANLPLLVLTQGRGLDGWSDLQRQLAARSRRGRQVLVPDSGHAMPMEAPGAIVDAVREIVAASRTDRVRAVGVAAAQ
jgi:pimeloyl-ACP methyl ester carboxylesterase